VAATRIAATALGVVMLATGAVAPAVAEQSTRSNEPQLTRFERTAAEELRESVDEARATYRSTVASARETRDEALAAHRSVRKRALKRADTKAERRKARRAYRRAAAPIKREYRTAKSAAAITRRAAIDAALADYLVATGAPEASAALEEYRSATETARRTLQLALASSWAAYRTDTADEREQLLADLEQADTRKEVAAAWKDYMKATADERAARAASVSAARKTYRSARAEARSGFREETDETVSSMLVLPFKL
jgi:hypothetical protein